MIMAGNNNDALHRDALNWVLSSNADFLANLSNESRRIDHERAKAKERVLRERQSISMSVRKSLQSLKDQQAKSERRRKRLVVASLAALSLVPIWMALVAGSHYYKSLPDASATLVDGKGVLMAPSAVRAPVVVDSAIEPAYGQMAQATTSFGVLSSAEGVVPSEPESSIQSKQQAKPEVAVQPKKAMPVQRKVVTVRASESEPRAVREPIKEEKTLGLADGSGTLIHSQPPRSISEVVAGDVIAPRGVSGVKGEKVLSVMPNGDVLTDLRLIGKGKLKNFQIVG